MLSVEKKSISEPLQHFHNAIFYSIDEYGMCTVLPAYTNSHRVSGHLIQSITTYVWVFYQPNLWGPLRDCNSTGLLTYICSYRKCYYVGYFINALIAAEYEQGLEIMPMLLISSATSYVLSISWKVSVSVIIVFKKFTYSFQKVLLGGELNPSLLCDRQGYWPLYYQGLLKWRQKYISYYFQSWDNL